MILPTKEQFKTFTGEAIEAHFSGDVKNIDKRFERLMQLSYEILIQELPGVITTDLTEDQETAWKNAIMQQAEVILSKGDAELMEVSYYTLSDRAKNYLRRAYLWRHIC